MDLLALSDIYNADMLRENCADFIRSNRDHLDSSGTLNELESLHLLKHISLEEPAKHLITLDIVKNK